MSHLLAFVETRVSPSMVAMPQITLISIIRKLHIFVSVVYSWQVQDLLCFALKNLDQFYDGIINNF